MQNIAKQERSSNLELFRIISMFLIVAHHYVVNSGIMVPMHESLLNWQSFFLFILGAWGKTGINCFVLITGYFMCKSQISLKKFAKLVLEVELYKFIFYFVFVFTGYTKFSIMSLF